MSIPLWVLLAFTAWTLLVLGSTIGVYRWARVLTGRATFETFAEYKLEGPSWYRRSLRAHANCVENLPVLAALVLVMTVADVHTRAIDVLALVLIGARIPHTLVHVCFEQTNKVVFARSMLFITQWICLVAMTVIILIQVAR